MPSRFAAVTNKEISYIIKQALPEIHKEGDEVEKFYGLKFCVFDLNSSIKPVEKVLFTRCKFSLSLALLYLVYLVKNKLKTKFDNIFYRMILNTRRIHNSF